MKKSEFEKRYKASLEYAKKMDEGKGKINTSTLSKFDQKYYASMQRAMALDLGLDTFETDINKLNKSINTATSGWQRQETMKNTLSSMQSMYDRLGKYQENRTKYGLNLPDLSELQKSYKSAIDNWGTLSESYGAYKDAKTYSKETESLKKFANMSSSEMKSHLDVLKAHLVTAEGYEEALKTAPANQVEKLQSNYKSFLKEIGFKDIDALRGRVAYTTVSGNNLTWDNLYKQKVEEENTNAQYNKLLKNVDFEKYRKIGANVKNPTYDEANDYTAIGPWNITEPPEIKNRVKFAIDNDMRIRANSADSEAGLVPKGVERKHGLLNDKERAMYEYHLGMEMSGKEPKGSADKYLESIDSLLEGRMEGVILSEYAEQAEQFPALSSIGSIATSLGSGVEYIGDTINYAFTGELDDNLLAKATNVTRGTVSNMVDWEIGNWDAFDFLYNTTMSGLDSATAAVTLGTGGGIALGLSAAAQGTNEALERGLDNRSAFFSGLASGVFEGLFESVSIGKFNALKDAPVDGIKTTIKNIGKTMLVNASEETLTELANLTYDYFVNADLSQFETQVRAYVNSGMSESEAKKKVAVEQGLQVGEAGLSGALMGFGFGAIGSYSGYKQSKSIGQNIKDNAKAQDVFDMASISPEASMAYEAYTRYANKGINADNVSNAQLGSLWQKARTDKENIAHNKKSTGNEILFAKDDYAKLGEMAKYNPEARFNDAIASDINKQSKKTKKALGKDADIEAIRKETADNATERLTELGQKDNVEEIANIIAKKSVGEEISAEEVKALRESEYGARVYAENDKGISEFVKGMDNVESRIFTQTYDGNTDIEAFANSFNLVSEYAKHPESFTVEDAVKNKGVLSEDDAKYIYAQLKTNEELKATKKNSELMARARKGERGIIDDSVINYGEKHIPGTVHWNSLNERQRQAVIFAKGLYKALGSNLAFVGKNKKFNGAYNVTKDITFIDVFAGRDYRTWTGTDTIISTISHEITHEMKVKTPEAHKILTDLAFRALEKSTGLTKSELIATEVEKLKNKGESHTDEDAIDEIVARACEDMLANSKEAKAMLKELSPAEQKTLVEKIQDIIQKIVDWIDEFLSSYKNQATSEEAKDLRQMKEEFEAMSAMWDKALREMQSFNKGTESNTSIETTAEVVAEATTETTAETSNRDNLSPVETESKTEVKEETKSEEKTKATKETSIAEETDGTVKSYLVGNTGKVDGAIVDEIGKDSIVDAIRKDRSDTAKAMSNDIASQTIEADKPVEIVYVPNANGKGIYAMYFAQTKDSRGGQIASVNALGGKTSFDNIYDMEFVNETGFMESANGGEDVATTTLTQKSFDGNPEVVKQLANDILEGKRQVTFTMDNIDVNNFNEVSCALFSEVSKYLPDSVKDKLGFKSQSFGSIPRYIRLAGVNSSVNVGNALNIDNFDTAKGKYVDEINKFFSANESERKNAVENILESVNEDKVRMMDRESESQKTFAEKTFGEQVDAVLSGEDTTSTHLQISEHTPKLLLDLGLTDKPMLITSVHTKTALGYKVKNKNTHNVSEEVLKNLPKLIETPAMAMESTKKGSIVMFVNAVDVNKTPVICSIKINGTAFYNNVKIESNVVTSVYGKDTNPIGFIESAVNDNRLLYWDKKMSQKLFDIPGLQLPDNIYNFDSNTIIRKIGENVNTEISNDKLNYQSREEDIYDIMGERDTAIKRAEKLSEDVSRLKELLKLERRITKGKLYNESSVSGVANFLKNKFGSKINKIELMKALKDVYTYMASADENNLEADAIYSKCEEVARSIFEGIAPVMDDYNKKILSDVRNTRVSLTEEQKEEVINRYGNNWPRYFIGSAIVANDGAPLSSVWADWAEQYPDKFSKDITDADMGIELLEAVQNMKDSSEVVDKYLEEERVSQIATEIYNAYWNIPPVKTTADKYSEKIKAIRAEHRKAIKEVRESQKLADDIHYAQKMREQKKKLQKQTYARIKDARAKAKQQGKEIGLRRLDTFKENANRKTVLQSTMATVMSLNKKLTTNSKEVHIPEELKPVVQELLNAIDFSSKQLLGMKGSKKDARGLPTKADMARENVLSKVHSMATEKSDVVSLRKAIKSALELFENAEKVLQSSSDGTVDSSIVALDTDMIKDINDMIESLDLLIEKGEKDLVLQKMSTENLEILNKMVKSINHWAIVADKALANKHKKRISDLGMQTVEETDKFGIRQEYVDWIEGTKNFFSWSNLLPVNAFKRLGDAAMEFLDGLRDALDKVTFNRQEVMDFTDVLLKKYKQYKPKNWRTEVKSFDVKLPGENKTTKVTMPVSYIMTLYCVAKQEDAQRHLYGMDASGNKLTYKDEKGIVHDGGGMTIKGYKEGKFSLKVNKNLDNTIVNENIVKRITSVLTKEQKEVADALQKFMNEKGSEWGDAVSMALYGIKKFGTENYFPITVSPHTLNADKIRDAKASLFSILNYGFTKERNLNAKQSIEIGDIFDVFANHMNMVAIYNAYALPVFDIARWYNFKGKTENGKEIAVTTSIEKAFGSGAVTYVNNLIKDLNGQHESSRLGFISKIFKNTKVAMVGNSISVALLQPTAYLKAMVKIPPKYLLKSALYVKDFGARKGVEKAKKYCGIALLKSQGYFETGVSANTTTKMMHDETWSEKATEWSLKGAEWMDERTWGVLWNACEFEVRATRKDLKVGSEEFYEVIGEKLRDVIYETQVVDSPLTKSDLMRSSDTGTKMVTMFASEMTVAYNMVFEAAYQTHLDSKKYGKKQALRKNAKNLSMTLMAYTMTSVANAALSALVDSFRYGDDDEDENKFLQNFLSDWLIVGKIPYFKEAISLAQGYSSSRTDTLWLQSAFKAIEYLGKEGKEMKALDESLKSFSYVSGFAVYNQWRDLRALLRFIGLTD